MLDCYRRLDHYADPVSADYDLDNFDDGTQQPSTSFIKSTANPSFQQTTTTTDVPTTVSLQPALDIQSRSVFRNVPGTAPYMETSLLTAPIDDHVHDVDDSTFLAPLIPLIEADGIATSDHHYDSLPDDGTSTDGAGSRLCALCRNRSWLTYVSAADHDVDDYDDGTREPQTRCLAFILTLLQTTTTSSTSSSSTDTESASNQNAVTFTTVSFATQTYTTSYGITTTQVSTAPGS